MSSGEESSTVRITIFGANALVKKVLELSPDPFAVVSVDSNQSYKTKAARNTLSPSWNQHFDITIKRTSTITIQVCYLGKFRKKAQYIPGLVKVTGAEALEYSRNSHNLITKDLTESSSATRRYGRLLFSFSVLPVSTVEGNRTSTSSTSSGQPQSRTSPPPSQHPQTALSPLQTNTVQQEPPEVDHVPASQEPQSSSVVASGTQDFTSFPQAQSRIVGSPSPSLLRQLESSSSSSSGGSQALFMPPQSSVVQQFGPSQQPQSSTLSVSTSPEVRDPLPSAQAPSVQQDHLDPTLQSGDSATPPIFQQPQPSILAQPQANARNQDRIDHAIASPDLPELHFSGLMSPSPQLPQVPLLPLQAGSIQRDMPASPSPPPQQSSVHSPRASERPQTTGSDRTNHEGPLPLGWSKRLTADGMLFFVDHNNQLTTWNDPRATVPLMIDGIGPLPMGWEMNRTSEGRWYFVNHCDRVTTWNHPQFTTTAGNSCRGPLPFGWQVEFSTAGKRFFANRRARTSTWDDPRSPRRRGNE
ncbi:hypothetical protein V8B97DRAFT_1871992 [Scleroderma yunnanense]